MAPPLRILRLATALLVVALALPSCMSARQRACVVPSQGRDVGRTLEGEWLVLDHEAEQVGAIRFEDERFRASSEDNTLFGTWALVERRPNEHALHLSVEGYDADGVRELYGAIDVVELRVVFANWDRVYALQSLGSWTRWDRAPLEPPVAPAP